MEVTLLKALVQHTGGTFLPILGAVHVYDGNTGRRVQVGNGRYTVDAPTDLPVMTVDADRLVTAVVACRDAAEITVTDANVLVKSGRVRARLPLNPVPYPVGLPTDAPRRHGAAIGEVLLKLAPLAAEDASRPWATAICLSGDHAYATNNVVLARYPLNIEVDVPVNIPAAVVSAVVERGEVTGFACDEHAATFFYEDGSWVRTGLIAGTWPTEVVDGYIAQLGDEWLPVHESLATMLATAVKVSQDKHPKVAFTGAGIELEDKSFEADDLGELPAAGKVNGRMAGLVFGIAEDVQWHSPKTDVHAFRAGELIGVFGGSR